MFKLRYLLIVGLCVGFFLTLKATHNRAGEITYKWLFGYTYEIKVTTYTNIGGSNLADRCEDTVYFGDGARALVLRSNGPIGNCSPAHDGIPLNPSIKLNEYVTTHSYPGPGNYLISMEDPNRNAGIINLPNSVNQVFYIESFLVIPTFGTGKNNSPVLTFPPIDNGCVTQCFYHNPGAYDIDGDSISYELTACKGSLGATCPGYSYPATSGGTFNLDSLTGTLTWCSPQLQGEYNMAILIKEWRMDAAGTYFLVGYIERDMQVDITSCSNVPPHILFNNLDTCILAGNTINTTITASDINSDILTLTTNGGPFAFALNPSTFNSVPSNSNVTGTFNWNTDSTHIRRLPYQVTVKAKDDNSIVNLVHFKTFNIKVIPYAPKNLSTISSNNNIQLRWNKPDNYSVLCSNSFSHYKIYRKNGVSNWTHTNQETTPPPYTGFVYIGSTNNNVNDTIFNDFNGGNPFTSGQDYSYVVVSEYLDGATSYVSNISSQQFFVGIEELTISDFNIKAAPNPCTDFLTLSFDKNSNELFKIELIDLTGRNLKTVIENNRLNNPKTITLNLEDIKNGIYFLKISGNNNTSITKKIIKQ